MRQCKKFELGKEEMSEDKENNSKQSPSSSSLPYVQQHLANERTFLAWLRTCIALIGLGFVISRFDLFLNRFSNSSLSDSNTSFANVDYASLLGSILTRLQCGIEVQGDIFF